MPAQNELLPAHRDALEAEIRLTGQAGELFAGLLEEIERIHPGAFAEGYRLGHEFPMEVGAILLIGQWEVAGLRFEDLPSFNDAITNLGHRIVTKCSDSDDLSGRKFFHFVADVWCRNAATMAFLELGVTLEQRNAALSDEVISQLADFLFKFTDLVEGA